jgi:serine/threonine-protein kinase RsbW
LRAKAITINSNFCLRMSDLHTNFKFYSDPTQVAVVEPFVEQVAERYNLAPDVHGNMLVSLTEAVTNAIIHGNCNDQTKLVSISLRRQKDGLAIRVSDQGRGFDPGSVPDPTSPECIEKCGGRGIFLMQNLADECRFMRGGSTVEMKWRL